VWNGKRAGRLLERDVATGMWRWRNSTGSVVVIVGVGWKVRCKVTVA